ncbi:MAG: MFS transporter [Pyrinomonadaceae bacterium]|nr:MFS transporter [Pyrinomonadaceae bacterium]
MQNPRAQTNSILKILLHLGFFASGICTVLIGQVLPILSSKFSLDDEQTANFFPAQFAGSLIGTFLTNWFGKKDRFLLAAAIGCIAMSAGVLMLNLGSFEICLAGFFVNGVGIGLTLPSINMLVLELDPVRAASALSILNFFWGFGAILSQPFVDLLSRGTDILLPTALLAAALLIVGLALFAVKLDIPTPVSDAGKEPRTTNPPIWSSPAAWAIAAFNFVHVGFESGMGGWLKTYTERMDSVQLWFPPIFLFYLFFVAGRGIAPLFFRFFDESGMLFFSLLVVVAGMITLLFARDITTLGIGASIAGFGTSAIFPTNMSRFTRTFGPTASRRATPFFICGTLGAAFTTWLIGVVSTNYSSLRSGMFILLGSAVLLLIIQVMLAARTKIRPKA